MIQKSELRLGLPVVFSRCYSINAKSRLPGYTGGEAFPDLYCKVTKGVVVGQRNYIMSNWKRTDYGEGDTIIGKQRPMLLVAFNLHRLPVLVDPQDAEIDRGVE